jgi:hypothetical protein
MKNDYNAPELKTVGQANQVVLGTLAIGNDISNEYRSGDSEFLADWE